MHLWNRKFEEELNTKVKLDIYKWFGKSIELQKIYNYIYMEYVMQEVDFCLSLDRVHTV